MDVKKSYLSKDVRKRIDNFVYLYGTVCVSKEKRLSLSERALYAALLDYLTEPNPAFKRGWIKDLKGKNIKPGVKSTPMARIKQNGWIFFLGKNQYKFPDEILAAVEAIKRQELIDFHIQL